MVAEWHFFQQGLERASLSGLLLIGVLSASCGETREVDQRPVAPVEILREPAVGNDEERFQQRRSDTLRLMIEAAKRELEIGPFQRRIDATVTQSLTDMKGAANALEQVATDLEDLLGQ